MRRVILFNMITLDGYFEGPGANIDWHHVDEEFNQFAVEQLESAGGLIFGRVTYQGMAEYWPTLTALETDPMVAEKMNRLPKYVFSRTLDRVDWHNSHLFKGEAAAEVAKLKQESGGDLYIFGSGNLATPLIRAKLVDEIRLIVNPVAIGSGTAMFKDIEEPLELKLLRAQVFRNGNVLLVYEPSL